MTTDIVKTPTPATVENTFGPLTLRTVLFEFAKIIAVVILLAVLVPSAPAWAGATLILQLRTDFLPVTEFAVVRTVMETTDPTDPTQTVFINEHVADGGGDYGTGRRIAEFGSVPTGIDWRGVVELIDGSGFAIARRPFRIELEDGVRVVTMLITRGDPPPDRHNHYTHWTSDEADKPRAECPAHTAVHGLACNGDNCDNLRLICSPVPGGLGNGSWTPFFSEEQVGLQGCAVDEFVTGIECSGNWCDDISLRCSKIPGTIESCYETGDISEEDPPFIDTNGFFVQRMSCSGSFCDNKRLELCRLNERLWTMRLFFDICVSVADWVQGDIDTGSQLVLLPCRNSDKGNLDQRWSLLENGRIVHPTEGLCLEPGQQGGFVTGACSEDDPVSWSPDGQNHLPWSNNPTLCLTVGGLGKPHERPQSPSPLTLEPCEDRADQYWELPGLWRWIFTDGFEGGNDERWSASVP